MVCRTVDWGIARIAGEGGFQSRQSSKGRGGGWFV